MDPILRIIKYLLKKKNISNEDESIGSFFDNGISFPQFVSIIFNIESIPGIKQNPISMYQKRINNSCALQYLFQKNEKIKLIEPNLETEKNQIYLLQLILTKQCFTENSNVIIDRSNIILNRIGIKILKKNELYNLKILSTIINILTNESFPISENFGEIIDNFSKFNIPLVIDENYFDSQNYYLFLIQYQIIFEIFIDKIDQIKSQENDPSLLNIDSKLQEQPITQSKDIKDQTLNKDKTQLSEENSHEKLVENEIIENHEMVQDEKNAIIHLEQINKDIQNDQNSDSLSDYSNNEEEDNVNILFEKYFERQNQNLEEINFENQKQKEEFEQLDNFVSDFSDSSEEVIEDNNNDNITIEKNDSNNHKKEEEEEEEEEEEASDDGQTENKPGLLKNLHFLQNRMSNLIKNMSKYKYSKSYDVQRKLQFDMSVDPEKIWNISINDYKYNNGIVFLSDEKIQIESKTKAEPNNLEQKQKYYKLFRYDEKKYCWQFIESNFKDLYNNSKCDMLCPIFLFINSKINEIDEITLTENDLIKNADEEISVYSFYMNSIKSDKSVQNINEPIFLYVHVPNKKTNHKNIGEILIQIYSFLFLVSDLDIIIINDQFKNSQIDFIMKIIDFSSLYLPNHNDQSFTFLDKSKILFLSTSNQITNQALNKEYLINCITKDKNEFHKIIDEIGFNKVYIYSDIFSILCNLNTYFPQLSSLYIYMRNKDHIYYIIRNILLKRFRKLISEKNKESVIQILKNECQQYYPKNDEYVSKILQRELLKIQIENKLFDVNNIEIQLKEQSKIHLSYLERKLNEKLFWDENEFKLIQDNHFAFIHQKFFEIIKNINENAADIIYNAYEYVLYSQEKEDKSNLDMIFSRYQDNINSKHKIINEKFDIAAKKGSNYVMKEVNKTKEIEVIIDAGEKIDSVIESDF